MKPNVTDDQRELFAHRLEELMASQSMSQSDLARAVWPVENMTFRPDHTGKYHQVYGRDRISAYVRGTIPNKLTLQRIARVLKVDADYLVPLRTSGVAPIPTLQRPVALMSITNEGTPPGMVRVQIDALVTMDAAVQATAAISGAKQAA
jgi:hypothetical protein